MAEYIELLSELRSRFNCFDDKENPYYKVLSEAIRVMRIKYYDNNGNEIEPPDMSQEIKYKPVVHGHWIQNYETDDGRQLRCSECGMVYWVGKGRDGNFCPNCGADMRGDNDG